MTNNNVSNNDQGIYLSGSSNNTLHSNIANSNDWSGICLGYSSNYHNTIANNVFINDGLFISGKNNGNTVENNTVNGKALVYFEDVHNFAIQNAGQVILVNCSNITVENLNLSNTSIGVELYESDDCKIVHSIANSNTIFGIYLRCSKNNTLQNNTVSNNHYNIDDSGVGIYLEYSSNNTLRNNIISNNTFGICTGFWNNNNILYHNNLINNTQNAYDSCTNVWDSGSEGNYYSDYTGTDNNTDGIGEDPYPIPGGDIIDRFPLMQPWAGDTQQLGDLNGDDRITSADAAIALAIAATGAHNPAADMSGDGKVTSLDALMILQAAVGSTTRKENRSAVIETSMGTMTAELYGQRAPNTTANFIDLAEGGFYDGLIFHRVIDDFVIQGGCPKGDGTGGSGKTIELEIHSDLTHVDGAIAMARSQDPDSASSQFYICDGAQHMLNGQYTVFGRVIDGINVVRAIAEVATDSRDKPLEDVVIIKISIIDRE